MTTEEQIKSAASVPAARNWQRYVAALIWLLLVGSFVGYSVIAERSPTETLQDIVGLLQTPFGPLLYILIYTLRPLAFFSAIVVTLLGGAIWGPLWGTLFVIIGSNMSATLLRLWARLRPGYLARGRSGRRRRDYQPLRRPYAPQCLQHRADYAPDLPAV